MIIYLPVAFLKDWICRYLEQRRSLTSLKVSALANESSAEINSPLRHKIIDMGLQGTIIKKDIEEDFFVTRRRCETVDSNDICFATVFVQCSALARTSVASTTVLSSTSGLFTFFIGAFLGQDTLNLSKVVAVFVTMAGVAMTTLDKTWAADESHN
ncbi:unnamed protein product [Microthlaspi erraticum]|uniref:EamA domain-containing protein n=1 Tax=Microthlaspi erraticum TaxID=1685480 RepID=A0A6D2L3R1_9BRAS|nr:unnamed protein product [Microthlaspi erraticum]